MTFLDEKWFQLLKESDALVEDIEVLQTLQAPITREKKRFLQDEVENPRFCISKKYIQQNRAEQRLSLEKLLLQIEKEESQQQVRELYLEKICRTIQRLDMLAATEVRDDETFARMSRLVYGKPKKRIFLYVAAKIQALFEDDIATAALRESQQSALKRLKKIFKKIDTHSALSAAELPTPIEDTELVHDAAVAQDFFQLYAEEIGLYGWKMVIDETTTRTSFSVVPARKVVNIPSTLRLQQRQHPLTKTGLRALAAHELGVHAMRAERGMQSPLQLLSTGLPSYLRGEEGVATYMQQSIEGATEYYGFDRYLAISLAMGMDGEKRDFRGVFELLRDYYLVTGTYNKQLLALATESAFNVTFRCFRGTTGLGTGTVFTRDLVYLEGNIGIWELVNTHPEAKQHFTIGKYDPLNKQHIDTLTALDIIPTT